MVWRRAGPSNVRHASHGEWHLDPVLAHVAEKVSTAALEPFHPTLVMIEDGRHGSGRRKLPDEIGLGLLTPLTECLKPERKTNVKKHEFPPVHWYEIRAFGKVSARGAT